VQPLVGPPDVVQGEPAALARPATLAELKTFMNETFAYYYSVTETSDERALLDMARSDIFQKLGTFDQGPIAKNSLEEICERLANQPDDPNSIDT